MMLITSFLLLSTVLGFSGYAEAGIAAILEDVAAPPSAPSSYATGCKQACTLLSNALKNKVYFPTNPVYVAEEALYWSNQQATQSPLCRVAPSTAQDISVALSILKTAQCQFAVKSGGHASFKGASNIDSGVAIDLVNLNTLQISADRKTVSAGTGLRWGAIYAKLDSLGLTVIGGRNAEIGAGGLTLGGGISYFSGLYGWACDNVQNYQVVFADGSINDVNQKSFPDLYFALRGGGNNFGIVTRMDFYAYPQGKMWGGAFNYLQSSMPALINAFHWFNIRHSEDGNAAVILSYVWLPSAGFVGNVDLEYAKPVADPPILKNFTSIQDVGNTGRITNLTDLTLELAATQPNGDWETFWAFMTKNDAQLMTDIQHLWEKAIVPIQNVSDVLPVLVFQPISTAMTSHFSKNGGNALGISVADSPLVLINISVKWSNVADSAAVLAYAQKFISDATALAKSRGLWFRYIYQNYAALQQDVFSGYGPQNKAKLQQIHQKYDPQNVWTKLQPGYFKIN